MDDEIEEQNKNNWEKLKYIKHISGLEIALDIIKYRKLNCTSKAAKQILEEVEVFILAAKERCSRGEDPNSTTEIND